MSPSSPPLAAILDVYTAVTLKEMLAYLGQPADKVKRDNIKLLAQALPQAKRVKRELHQLNEAEKVVVARLLQRNGQIHYTRLHQLLTLHPDLLQKSVPQARQIMVDGQRQPDYLANPHYTGVPTFEDLLARLAMKGLVLSQEPLEDGRTTIDWRHGRSIILPDYVRPHLKQLSLPELPNPALIDPPQVVTGSAHTFLRDLGRYGRYLRRHGSLRLTTQHQLYKDDLKALAAEMSFKTDLGSGKKETDNGRLLFLRSLLPKVELARQHYPHQSLQAIPTSPFWQMSLTARAQQAFLAWQDKGIWFELLHLNLFERGANITSSVPAGLVRTRKIILRHMANMGRGWINIQELIEEIRSADYGFLFEKRTPSSWSYYGYKSTIYDGNNNPYALTFQSVRDEKDGWNKIETDLINHVIAGPLHWMGLVDLGYLEKPPVDLCGNKPVAAYRLTPMGCWLLGLGSEPEFTGEGGALVVQPNFEIVVMAPFDDEALLTLDQFARPTKEDNHVITYEIDRASVYTGQKTGWPVTRVMRWLEGASHQPLPQNVHRSLEEWDSLHQRITIRRHVCLLEASAMTMADQVAPMLAQEQTRRLTPTVFLSASSGEQVATTLREAGWPPMRTAAGDTTAPNSVHIDRDGRITFTHPAPSIYARGVILPLSADTGHGRELTAAQVRAVAQDRKSLATLINNLTAIHTGPLPDALVNHLKAWSHYYGDARQETVVLMEFRDETTRAELLADPDVGRYLKPFAAPGRALATIHPLHLETVHALLAERGLTIHEGLKG